MKKYAIISVFEKEGIVSLAEKLVLAGYDILSTGGSAQVLRKGGIPVLDVSEYTGFSPCFEGRVKTLHPRIHGGILFRRDREEDCKEGEALGICPIDVVVVDLYPFEQTVADENATKEMCIEKIDIGGPSMIRGAAKNHAHVTVVCDKEDYGWVGDAILSGDMGEERRFALAAKAFRRTAAYDAAIANWFAKKENNLFPERMTMTFERVQQMRYGENPHQVGAFYKEVLGETENTLVGAEQLWGKELSYNNINDANGALELLKEFPEDQVVCVASKHANPCGVAIGRDAEVAFRGARDADPMSVFGGIIAINRVVDAPCARQMAGIFLEIIIAPDFTEEALEILKQKKNLRLLRLPGCSCPKRADVMDMKKVMGGLLIQQSDVLGADQEMFSVVTDRAPTAEEMNQLRFVWRVVKHVKSNGIALAKNNATTGIGPGQTGRVTATEIAIRYAGGEAKGSVMGSDAFFPFADCVKLAAKAGITAIVQPGGSVRDEESIAACNAAGIAMVFTGNRHFKH